MKKSSPGDKQLHPNHIGIGEALGYMFGDMGNLFCLSFITSYLKVFYTDCLLPGHGVDAATISRDLTVLFLVIRLWDVVNDPLWGIVVDKRRPSKNGKFRPYLRAVAIPLGASVMLCFFNLQDLVSNYTVLLAFAYISYCLFGMMYTGMNIPYGSLASAITDDPEGRTLLSTTRSIGGGVGGAAVTLVAQKLIYDNSTVLNPKKTFIASIVLGCLAMAAYITCFATVRERVHYSAEKKKVDLKLTYGSLFKSRPFLTVTVAGLMISGLLEFGSFNQYLTKNYFGNSDLSILLTMSTYAPMVVLILFVPAIAKKFGKKEITTAGLAVAVISSLILCIIGPSEQLRQHYVPFIIGNFGVGTGYCFLSILTWAIVTDVIDYQESKTGIKNESAIYAVYTFSRKLGQTLATVVGLRLLYNYAGYDPENAAVAGYMPGVGERIYKMVTRVMLIAYAVTFVMFLLYPLNKKKLAALQEELAVKRREREAEQDAAALSERSS